MGMWDSLMCKLGCGTTGFSSTLIFTGNINFRKNRKTSLSIGRYWSNFGSSKLTTFYKHFFDSIMTECKWLGGSSWWWCNLHSKPSFTNFNGASNLINNSVEWCNLHITQYFTCFWLKCWSLSCKWKWGGTVYTYNNVVLTFTETNKCSGDSANMDQDFNILKKTTIWLISYHFPSV